MHKVFARRLGRLIRYAEKNGIHVELTEVFRTAKEQAAYYAAGKSTKDGVYNLSKHQLGRAADLVVFKGNMPVWERCAEYEQLGAIWKQWGGRWGGDWQSLNDIYHFEV